MTAQSATYNKTMINIANRKALYFFLCACLVALTVVVFLLAIEKQYTITIFGRLRNFEQENLKFSDMNRGHPDKPSGDIASELIVNHKNTQINEKTQETPGKNFTIGLYHFYHGGLQAQAREVNMAACLYKQCKVTFIKQTGSGPYDVDALLFQGNNVPRELPVYRNVDQVFVFINIESPQYLSYTNWKTSLIRNQFNWTMTYRQDSDIPYLYGRIVPSNFTSEQRRIRYRGGYSDNDILTNYMNKVFERPTGIVGKDYENVFNRKTKHASWLVSHCVTASKRERYVKAMQEEIHIDIYGKCSNRSCDKQKTKCEPSMDREYMFYIAFENSLCQDYITEKVYRWFEKDILVVVRGARNYPVHLPKGTYIDADDFDSATSLARYLAQLAGNKTEYIRMLKRKDSYSLVSHKEIIQMAYCNLCERLHNLDMYRKNVIDLHGWWTHGICKRP